MGVSPEEGAKPERTRRLTDPGRGGPIRSILEHKRTGTRARGGKSLLSVAWGQSEDISPEGRLYMAWMFS